MIYELKYLLQIFFPKRLGLFVFLISFGKELKALWPVEILHLGNLRSFFCLVSPKWMSERCDNLVSISRDTLFSNLIIFSFFCPNTLLLG